MNATASRSVSWWPTHEFVAELLAQANTAPPMAGTPAWCALADDDPLKLLSLAQAGEHHVLRMEVAQGHRAAASRAVAASVDWGKVGREIHQRAEFRAAHPWSRRKAVS
ncbi:DUF2742 domain-containing protein [Mycolicibacter sinensis]|uniref:DUF2742 domain-containing protein n=1 Tax=Mycolicibacter sinensis (strain JDM601) TaxID=875328 RepID=A0A1A3U9G6_MYCSD|nr:DUF2742 domain-containing protein [Mycolicibacter sinensis]OBK91479.1 hypothetical protein A5648_14045 [Mycolicibacter sinensis]